MASGKGKRRNNRHEGGHDCDRKNEEKGGKARMRQSPNAYERLPKSGKSDG